MEDALAAITRVVKTMRKMDERASLLQNCCPMLPKVHLHLEELRRMKGGGEEVEPKMWSTLVTASRAAVEELRYHRSLPGVLQLMARESLEEKMRQFNTVLERCMEKDATSDGEIDFEPTDVVHATPIEMGEHASSQGSVKSKSPKEPENAVESTDFSDPVDIEVDIDSKDQVDSVNADANVVKNSPEPGSAADPMELDSSDAEDPMMELKPTAPSMSVATTHVLVDEDDEMLHPLSKVDDLLKTVEAFKRVLEQGLPWDDGMEHIEREVQELRQILQEPTSPSTAATLPDEVQRHSSQPSTRGSAHESISPCVSFDESTEASTPTTIVLIESIQIAHAKARGFIENLRQAEEWFNAFASADSIQCDGLDEALGLLQEMQRDGVPLLEQGALGRFFAVGREFLEYLEEYNDLPSQSKLERHCKLVRRIDRFCKETALFIVVLRSTKMPRSAPHSNSTERERTRTMYVQEIEGTGLASVGSVGVHEHEQPAAHPLEEENAKLQDTVLQMAANVLELKRLVEEGNSSLTQELRELQQVVNRRRLSRRQGRAISDSTGKGVPTPPSSQESYTPAQKKERDPDYYKTIIAGEPRGPPIEVEENDQFKVVVKETKDDDEVVFQL